MQGRRYQALRRWLRSDGIMLAALVLAAGYSSERRGQDNWWDVINYHIYNPWSLLHHRWGKDLFVAGIQSYFSPLADVPYYLVSMQWLPDWPRLVSALAAIPYGILVYVTVLLTRDIVGRIPNLGRAARILIVAATTLLAVTGVSVWTQAGTTTNGITVATLVLAAVYLLVKSVDDTRTGPGNRTCLGIGALLGLAAGLKLTATIYAPATGLIILGVSPDLKTALRAGSLYFIGWLAAFALLYGPWAWHLFETTGNPFFPFFNNIFHTSFSANASGRDRISMPHGIWQWLFYPFYWLDPKHPSVYNVHPFRDARVLLFYIVAPLSFIGMAVRRVRGKKALVPIQARLVAYFVAISYVVWLFVFSMLRYAIPIEVLSCVAGITLIACALASLRTRHANIISVAAAVLIAVALMRITVYPYAPRIGYHRRVFSAQVPRLDAHALVVFANQPMGILAPMIQSVNKDATFVGIPRCFSKTRLCYWEFYHHRLGRQLRHKLTAHAGPMYVAYYFYPRTALAQLPLFHLKVERHGCSIMHTDVTRDVMICPARHVPAAAAQQAAPPSRLDLVVQRARPGVSLQPHWLADTCSGVSTPARLRIDWRMPASTRSVDVFSRENPSQRERRFASGKRHGHATTGLWVRNNQSFIFKSGSGRVLAVATTRHVPCDAAKGASD